MTTSAPAVGYACSNKPSISSALKGLLSAVTKGFLVAELSQIISEATAPAFLLGAAAAFISVLIGRLNRVVDRGLALGVIKEERAINEAVEGKHTKP